MNFQGLLHEIGTDSFELVEESGPRVKGHIPSEIVCDDEETESAMASAQEQREEELQVIFSDLILSWCCNVAETLVT